MNKLEFLARLEKLLKGLPKKERETHLSYYREMIEDAIEDGCAEEEAIARIGSPGEIAEQILSEQETPAKPVSAGKKIVIAILLIIGSPLWGSILLAAAALGAGVLITVLALVLCAYIVIWCLPVTTGALSLSCLLLAVVSTVGAFPIFFSNAALGMLQFGVGILSAGVFILAGWLTLLLGSYFVRVTVRFSRWLKRLFTRRKEAIA